MKKEAFVSIILVFAVLMSGCSGYSITPGNLENETTAVTSETTEDTFDYGSMENPIDVDYLGFSSVREGEYIRVTGAIRCYQTEHGRITIGDNGGYGLEIKISNNSGSRCYIVQAPRISPGDFADAFASHCPADVSFNSSNVGGYQYCGCTATIVGRLQSYSSECDGETTQHLRFSRDSVVTDLNFYY